MVIRIDSTKCNSVAQGWSRFSNGMEDYWYYSDQIFETGKSYGLVSEYMQGCMYLSYMLGGKINPEDGLEIYIDAQKTDVNKLNDIGWNIEPYYEKYKNFVVRKTIENALRKELVPESFEQIAKAFVLTEPRYDRKLSQLSGERWRASAAIGYALGKRVFFGPYASSEHYSRMNALPEIIRFLKEKDCMIVLPVGSDIYIKRIVDQCIYLEPKNYQFKDAFAGNEAKFFI